MSFGLQVGSYAQLGDAVAFLKEQGIAVKFLPPQLFPGIDYCAFAIDPDGHALQLYYYMEQVGWDGRPRLASQRPVIDNANWPESIAAASDTFTARRTSDPWVRRHMSEAIEFETIYTKLQSQRIEGGLPAS